MSRLILAHDLGTSADKATLFSEDGELLDSASHPYQSNFMPGGKAEQDPEDWWTAVVTATRKLLQDQEPDRVAAIAFSGMMMGCLCVDKAGKPLRPHILYCDQRSTVESDYFIEQAGAEKIYRVSGNRPSPSYSAAKYMWIKDNEPDIYKKTYKFLNAKDFLNFRFTGRLATEQTDASGSNIFDLKQNAWSQELIDAAGLDADKLPEVVPSTSVLGELTREAAGVLGLRPGIPVIAGSADGIAATVGIGSVAPGRPYACVGSSSWVAVSTTEPVYDEKQRTITFAHAVPGLYNPMGIMQVGGGNYVWLRSEICHEEERLAKKEGRSVYEVMGDVAAKSPVGANSLLYLPYLMGERSPHWNPIARGGFVGLSITHTRSDIIRSVLEGVAYNLSASVDVFRDQGVEMNDMLMIGGGAKGDLWRQIIADVFDVEIQRPNYLDEATSTGAAILAGIGSGIFPDFTAAERFYKITDRTIPIAENTEVYKRRKKLFDKVYYALEPLFPEFAEE